MMAFFVIKNRPIEACTIVLVMVISVFYMVISYEEVYDLNKINDDEEPVAKRVKPSDDALNRWKNDYEHPLILKNVKMKA